ncbi:hypothetical protein K491DRAFT_692871, partial [Lophiostoma macrostomum CBS 122681]
MREMIYSYVLEPSMTARRTFLEYVPRSFNQGTDALAVTQVCRHFRQEIRPSYLKVKRVAIRLQDLPEYLSAFYPSVDNDAMRATATGSLGIYLEPYHYKDKVVDILPLMKLMFDAPKFTCIFGSDYREVDRSIPRRAANLNVLFSMPEEFARCRNWLIACRIHLKEGTDSELRCLPTIVVVLDSAMLTSPAHKYPYNDLAFIRSLEAFGNFRVVKQTPILDGCTQDIQLIFSVASASAFTHTSATFGIES